MPNQSGRDNLITVELEAQAQLAIVHALSPLPERARQRVFVRVERALFGVSDDDVDPEPNPLLEDGDDLDEPPEDAPALPEDEFDGQDLDTSDAESVEQDDDEDDQPPAPKPRRRLGRATAPKVPRLRALDETVALAMKLGSITNADVASKSGLTSSGADQRIQAAKKAGRILRDKALPHGTYVAAAQEYERIGLPPSKQGREMSRSVESLVGLMQQAKEREQQPDSAPPTPSVELVKRSPNATEVVDLVKRGASATEVLLVSAFNGRPRKITELAEELFEGNASRVRNALRRPVKWGLLKQTGRGEYARAQ